MPAGVVNVVPCSRARVQEVGAALCDSPKVQAVSFTGSTEVGQVRNVLLLKFIAGLHTLLDSDDFSGSIYLKCTLKKKERKYYILIFIYKLILLVMIQYEKQSLL